MAWFRLLIIAFAAFAIAPLSACAAQNTISPETEQQVAAILEDTERLVESGPAPQKAEAGTTDRRIAITFDDIPRSPGVFLSQDARAQRLINILDTMGVEQAAFFVNPGRIPKREGAVARIEAYVAAGHVIANHTANHPRLSQVTTSEFVADIDAAADWLDGREGTRPWFRFPYLDEGRDDVAKRDAVREALASRSLVNAYVTVDASDWFYESAARQAIDDGEKIDLDALGELFVESHIEAAEFYANLAQRATGRAPAHTLLLHESDVVALFLPDLINALRAEGWRIITADEAYADPVAIEATRYDTPSAGGTLIELLAWQKGLPAPRWYARNDTRLARAEFRKRVLGGEDTSED